eukprot:m.52507 g.52507  ORF g.52507 m.52507 type:complete len:86 (+) comp34215_c0_seq2:3649-3906(+)
MYLLIATQIRLSTGPTICGDDRSDPAIMKAIGATLTTEIGKSFSEYVSGDAPRVVLDKLEQYGFRVVSSSGVGQTIIWTMHREDT